MKEPLLPIRHPERDFFIADIFDSLPAKCDRHTMEYPFFTLSTKPDMRVLEYKRDGVSVKIVPHAELGLPTMMDKDILLYVGSLVMKEINEGRIPPKTIRFSCHDLMITTNRHTNDIGYKMLANGFERITGALITTDIKTKDIEQFSGFHILDKFTIIKTSYEKRRMVRVQVTLSDWFYNALIGREVLTINRDYFRLRKPLERRLYELARKHCGQQMEWVIGLENLHAKCGSVSPLKKFRYQIKTIEEANHLPDYVIKLDSEDKVHLLHRVRALIEGSRGKAAAQEQARGVLTKDNGSAARKAQTAPTWRPVPSISPAAYRLGQQIVDETGTWWDYRAILDQYQEARESGRFTPNDHNKAFIGFVKKKVSARS